MPKGPIIDYIVVRDNDHEQFAGKVMEKIQAGYECRHKMRTEQVHSHYDYVQNMVKRGPRPSQDAAA